TIGYATRSLDAGAWVREEHIAMPDAPPLEGLVFDGPPPDPLPPLPGYTFQGYRNTDGSAGTRNLLGIATTVQCVAPTVDYAVQRIRAEILPRYPNVDGVISVTHSYGCGVAMEAPGEPGRIQMQRHISLHSDRCAYPI